MDLILGLLFGAIGTVYLVYGKRQADPTFLVTGFVLVIYPYFVSNLLPMFLVGAVVTAVPIARHKGLF